MKIVFALIASLVLALPAIACPPGSFVMGANQQIVFVPAVDPMLSSYSSGYSSYSSSYSAGVNPFATGYGGYGGYATTLPAFNSYAGYYGGFNPFVTGYAGYYGGGYGRVDPFIANRGYYGGYYGNGNFFRGSAVGIGFRGGVVGIGIGNGASTLPAAAIGGAAAVGGRRAVVTTKTRAVAR